MIDSAYLKEAFDNIVRRLRALEAKEGKGDSATGTADVAVAKVGGGTRTLHFVNGLYTGYTDS